MVNDNNKGDIILKILDREIKDYGNSKCVIIPATYIKEGKIDPKKKYDMILKEANEDDT